MIITIDGMRLASLANSRTHWRALAKVKANQRRAVAWSLMGHERPQFPVVVTLTRVGVRDLDDDNLASAFKAVRDELAAWLGCDDGPRAPVSWRYAQRRGEPKEYAVEIQIDPKETT